MRILRFVLIIAGCLVALGTLVVVLVARNPERRVARLLDEAQIHKRTGRLELATKCLEDAVALKPADPGLKAKLARNLSARGELAKAEDLFEKAIAGNPDDVESHFNLFEVELDRGELDKAEDELKTLDEKCRVLANEGARDRVHAARATLLLRRGDRRGAERELADVLGVNAARDSEIRITLAQLAYENGEAERGEKLARDVWQVRRPRDLAPAATDDQRIAEEARFAPEPSVIRAAGFLATILLARRAPDEAAAIAAEAWNRDTKNADLALVLAEAELARNGQEAALAVATKLDEQKESVAALVIRGRAALARGEKDKALESFREASKLAPGVAGPALQAAETAVALGQKDEAAKLVLPLDGKTCSLDQRVARARILRECGRDDDARKDVDAVLEQAPGHEGAIDLLVRIELAAGHAKELLARVEALAKRSPGNGFLDKARSLVAIWQQQPGQAAEIERAALQASRGADGGAAELLTAALVLDGGVGAAVRELENVAAGSKEDAVRQSARLQAAELYLALGRADLALPVLERGLAEQPRSRELRMETARAQIALGKGAEAVTTLGPLTDGTGEPHALVLAASAALKAKRAKDAVGFARRASDDPTIGVEALSVLALAAREAHDPEAARDAFARLRERRPSAPFGYTGSLGELREKPANVAKVLKDAVSKASEQGFAVDLAVALDLAGRSDEAATAARSALAGNKQDATAAYVLAAVLARKGESDAAQDALLQAQVSDELRTAFRQLPAADLSTFEALIAYRRHGLDSEAAEEASGLATKHPKNLVVALHAARALAAVGRGPEAERILATAVEAAPKFAPARLELGALRRATSLEAALETYKAGLEAVPGDQNLELALGLTLSEMNRGAEAEAAYRSVLKADAKNAIARNNLAWLLLERGSPESLEEGLALARGAVADAPGNPFPLDTVARLELAKGETKDALAHSRQAVSGAPSNATIRLGLAKALDASGDARGAANEYEIALLLSASFEGRDAAEARLAQLRAASSKNGG